MTTCYLPKWYFYIPLAVLGALGFICPNELTGSLSFTLTLLVVLLAIVAACTRHDHARNYWIGFSVVAATYFIFAILLDYIWILGLQLGIAGLEPPQAKLVTSYPLALLFDLLHPTQVPAFQLVVLSDRSSVPRGINLTSYNAFMTTGHSIFTIVFGLLGGWLGGWLSLRGVESQ